jgi:uracil-DNA glycosylase family 4
MAWTERQRAMLRAMGLAVWSPPATQAEADDAPVVDPARPPAGDSAGDFAGNLPIEVVAAPGAPASAPTAPRPAPAPAPAPAAPARLPAPRAEMGEVAAMGWPALRAAVAACQACKLCESRTQTVFGVGHPNAHWMIVGEAPGEQEDLKGEPFVGAAGQLLDAMLSALGLSRGEEGPSAAQVFIANTLKCRPPRNRNPDPEELARCEPFLRRQIELVQPRVILAMGRFALQQLLRSDEAVGRLRGRVHTYEGVPLIVTYHPAYLLRQPADKAKAWEDLCLAASVVDR